MDLDLLNTFEAKTSANLLCIKCLYTDKPIDLGDTVHRLEWCNKANKWVVVDTGCFDFEETERDFYFSGEQETVSEKERLFKHSCYAMFIKVKKNK